MITISKHCRIITQENIPKIRLRINLALKFELPYSSIKPARFKAVATTKPESQIKNHVIR
jgi:hypothetical protein